MPRSSFPVFTRGHAPTNHRRGYAPRARTGSPTRTDVKRDATSDGAWGWASDRGTAISAASQRASVWLLTRYSRGARVRLCEGGRVEARWMLGDGAARGATPSALAKSTPSPLLFPSPRPFSSSPGMLFPPSSLSRFLSPLSYSAFHFSTSFCLFPPPPFFFLQRLFCLPSVSLSIFRSNVARPFFPLCSHYVLNFVTLHATRGRVVRSICRRGGAPRSRGELISSVVRRVLGCCRNDVWLESCVTESLWLVRRILERKRERGRIVFSRFGF